MMCWQVIPPEPDVRKLKRSRVISLLIIFSTLFLLEFTLLSQETSKADSVISLCKIPAPEINRINLSYSGLNSSNHNKLKPPDNGESARTLVFLDSLKSKASKTLITKKLYDLIISTTPSSPAKNIEGSADTSFTAFSGRIIRNINIKRLNTFGTNINFPDLYEPNKLEEFLNKTHFSTNELIIRKNILFSTGDTISMLLMNDNERILRQLPYIQDARIIIVPVEDKMADIYIVTKDVYSLAAEASFSGIKKGSFSVFEKNIFGMGHEFGIEIPHDSKKPHSPGFGIKYLINNISKTFINMNLFYFDGLGKRTYGFDMSRSLVSSATKYAGGISVRQMFTTEDLDTLSEPEPLKYNFQDYWLARSFLLNKESVTRLVVGARYYNNNVFDHPLIMPDSFLELQRYKMFMGSVSISTRKYYKTNLVYAYGNTEDIPFGTILNLSSGYEISEFKKRFYSGINFSFTLSVKNLGYFYSTAGFATYFNEGKTEQGFLLLRTNYISNLLYLGKYRLRSFVNADYSRGFDRYSDEHLVFNREYGFSGFSNDSISGNQRVTIGLETVLFSPVVFYGFKFAFFGFADFGFLFGTNEFLGRGDNLTGIGVGVRIGNDNLVFKTFQIRLGFFPNAPEYSRINNLLISGEPRLKPINFEPGPPAVLTFE